MISPGIPPTADTPFQERKRWDSRRYARALVDNQRIEIGIGAVGRLIKKFRLSSYVPPDGFAELIGYLAELFYFIKTETRDGISDADLADFMYDRF